MPYCSMTLSINVNALLILIYLTLRWQKSEQMQHKFCCFCLIKNLECKSDLDIIPHIENKGDSRLSDLDIQMEGKNL